MKLPPLNGLDFIEYASPEPEKLEEIFQKLGFVKTAQHNKKKVLLYQLADIHFVINKEEDSFFCGLYEAEAKPLCQLHCFSCGYAGG